MQSVHNTTNVVSSNSYRSSLRFVAVQWILAELWLLDLKFGQIFSCHHFFSLCFEILTWFLVYECIMEKLAYSKNIWWCTITRYNSGPLKVRCLKIKLDQYYINLNVITKKWSNRILETYDNAIKSKKNWQSIYPIFGITFKFIKYRSNLNS
jgi:hypothetical protein